MDKKIALVTGGMGGIGTDIVRHLADNGAKVVVAYYKGGDHSKAEEWQAEQKTAGYDFDILYSDLTDFEQTTNLVDALVDRYGELDILVNNAGVTEDITLAKMQPEQWHKVIDNNLHSIFNVTKNAIAAMLRKQYGRIVNISSINGQKGQFGQTNYCAAKAGMHGFTKALAYEVARKGITVNTVSPGYVRTPMTEKIKPEILEQIKQQIPIGRLAEPEEIARMVGFLVSSGAGYITGANFSINGGQHMF